MKSTKKPTAHEELVDASTALLINATDLGENLVDEDRDDEDYPVDEDGDAWYHDWWAMRQALKRCETEAINNANLLDSLDNLVFEAKGYLNDLAKHGVDATCLIGAIRRAEKSIKKAKG